MKHFTAISILLASLAGAIPASAASTLDVHIDHLAPLQRLPDEAASCRYVPPDHVFSGLNRSIDVHWSPGPDGTRSYALIMFDRDVPDHHAESDSLAQAIPVHAPRHDFTHWLRANIPSGTTQLPEATAERYHGPCPPWNDSKAHRYVVRIFALDIAEIQLPPAYDRRDLEQAMRGHILATGEVTQTYTENPSIR